jgi:glycosyltransferase involved in cell wall biosynthesis
VKSGDKPIIQVVLPIYFGSRYLPALLDSLVQQEGVKIALFIGVYSDDLDSLEILNHFSNSFYSFSLHYNSSHSPLLDYFELIKLVDTNLCLAYCDHDDVWMPRKLISSYRAVGELNVPALAVVGWESISENGSKNGVHSKNFFNDSIDRHLFEGNYMGNSMLLNKQAVAEIKSSDPSRIIMHDWWTTLVVALKGHIVHVPERLLLYRLHEKNEVGISSLDLRKYFLNRLRLDFFRDVQGQLLYLKESHGELTQRAGLQSVDFAISLYRETWSLNKFYIFLNSKYRSSKMDNLLLKAGFFLYKMNKGSNEST